MFSYISLGELNFTFFLPATYYFSVVRTENMHATEQRSNAIVSRSLNTQQEGPINPTYPQVSNSSEGHTSIQMFQASSSNGLDELPHMLQPSMNCHSHEIGFTSNGFYFSTLGPATVTVQFRVIIFSLVFSSLCPK